MTGDVSTNVILLFLSNGFFIYAVECARGGRMWPATAFAVLACAGFVVTML